MQTEGSSPAPTQTPPADAERAANTERVKALALKAGGDVVGIAPVERWESFVPEGYRPYDILPNATSVIVVGVRGA